MPLVPSTRRDSLWLSVASVLGRALAFLVFRHFCRVAGAEDIGVWGVAVEVSAILVVVASFGLDNLLTREVIRSPHAVRRLLFSSLKLRLLAGAGGFLVLLGLLEVSDYDTATRDAVRIMAIGLFFEACALSGDSIFQARGRIGRQAATQLVAAVCYFGLAWRWIDAGYGVQGVVWAHLASRLLRLLLVLGLVAPLLRGGAEPSAGSGTADFSARWLAVRAWPLFLAAVLGIVAFKIDTLLVMSWLGKTATGNYTVGRRLLDLLALAPHLFTVAVYPSLQRSRMQDETLEHLNRTAPQALGWVMTAAVPLAVGGLLAARPLVALLVTATGFEEAVDPLRIMMVGLPILSATFVANRLVLALGRERWLIGTSALALAATVALNLVLLPRWGASGAAYALVGALATALAAYVVILARAGLRMGLPGALAGPLLRTALAWALVVAVARWIDPDGPVRWWGMVEAGPQQFALAALATAGLYAGLTLVGPGRPRRS